MNGTAARERRGFLGLIAAGLLGFAAGAALALALLPEWSTAEVRSERFFAARYHQLAARAGFQPLPGRPQVTLMAGDPPAHSSGKSPGSSLQVEVSHGVRSQDQARSPSLAIVFSPDGRPRQISWNDFTASVFSSQDPAHYERLAERIMAALLDPGESLGRRKAGSGFPGQRNVEIAGSSQPEHLRVVVGPPFTVLAERQPGGFVASSAGESGHLWAAIALGLVYVALFLAIVGVSIALLVRGQIDLTNGAILALVTLLSANLGAVLSAFQPGAWMSYFTFFGAAPGLALWVFLVWSAGESLLRSLRPDFTTSLDTLRLGRLGPRGGRALLLGFGYGALIAGALLALHALATVLPGIANTGASLPLPIFSSRNSPLGSGISAAAMAALALALALRFLPERWSLPAASLLAGYVISRSQIDPFAARLAADVAFAAGLVWICRRHGLTALLAASITSFLLPALLFSALHFDWLPGSFALTSGMTVLLLVLGFVGVARSAEEESGEVPTPAFMRRLTEERRIRHEVDLLARMQEGLLPKEMPRLAGYEIAARSVLAAEAGGDLYDFLPDDAGGLWIAAGDVAGHGYSCAIAQAMVKAGLLSLAAPEESPGGVLRQLDRVLRGVVTEHSFTSLAVIRLDPATGDAELANAGYPYPLLMAGGKLVEIELPGPPLGQGPAQAYAVRPFQLPAGGVLVLCSDGLFKSLDRGGNAYGFERAREVLRAIGHRPALEIVDTLLSDCRRHLGTEQAPDDVTVVVIKRG